MSVGAQELSKRAEQLIKDPALLQQLNQLDAAGWVRPTSQRRAEDTRDRLIEAAEEVFAEKGYTGARITDITDRAGLSPASVYVRFKDKDGLFNAVLDRFRDQAGAMIGHFIDGTALDGVKTESAIHATVIDNAVKFSQHAGIIRATLQRAMSEPETMERFLRLRQTLIDHISGFVARRQPNEDAAAIKARMADAFDVIYGALIMRIIFQGDRSSSEEFATFLAGLIVPYIIDS
ncbi:MAG: TetR/AcrR family transcriptional regulator [Alphaproteobacteria bacterium]